MVCMQAAERLWPAQRCNCACARSCHEIFHQLFYARIARGARAAQADCLLSTALFASALLSFATGWDASAIAVDATPCLAYDCMPMRALMFGICTHLGTNGSRSQAFQKSVHADGIYNVLPEVPGLVHRSL